MSHLLVLYEDSRTSKTGTDLANDEGYSARETTDETFAFHERFLLTLVGERLTPPQASWELLAIIEGWPLNANNKVLARLREKDTKLSHFHRVIATLDNDRIRLALGLSKTACKGVVVDSIRQCATPPLDRQDVILFVENLESIIRQVEAVIGEAAAPAEWVRARNKKPGSREVVFQAVSKADFFPHRERLLSACPSLKRLVDRLVLLLSAGSASTNVAVKPVVAERTTTRQAKKKVSKRPQKQ